MKILYYLIAKVAFTVGYFRGSSLIQSQIVKHLPVPKGRINHPLGFSWLMSSRDSLSTYLTSCEPFTTKVILSQVDEFDSFVCIGANRGWYPLLVGAKNKQIQLFAFECNSAIYDELSQNISKNRNQAELFRFAIGESDSQKNLFMPQGGNEGMSTLYPIGNQKNGASIVEVVNVTSLDTCLKETIATLGRTLILMDIEGSEMQALKGASIILSLASPTLILEINTEMLFESGSSFFEVFEFLRSHDYRIFWIDERGHLVSVLADNHLPHSSILPSGSGANYLFVKHGEIWIEKFVKS